VAIASKPRSTPTAVSQGTQHQQSQKYRAGFIDFNSFNNAMQRFSRDMCQSTKQ
jgi:hypothetical protein